VLTAIVLARRRIGRAVGAILVGAYLAYLTALLLMV